MTVPGAAAIDAEMLRSLPAEAGEWYRAANISAKLAVYLELLVRWNGVVSLTSVSTPEAMVRRHFAESVFAAHQLPRCETLLDLGSGAGFPGIPMQLVLPALDVTLVEAQARKAAFLREVVRELGLPTTVVAGRSQLLGDASFDCVCLRAVDPMVEALGEAARLARSGVVVLGSRVKEGEYRSGLSGWEMTARVESANGVSGVLVFAR